ncbi:MAG: hypothetical protein KDN18_04000 [Verrucomicrobiae bacterium]|nr:hypothetical protein [Verrucomicrobiae bacterium]
MKIAYDRLTLEMIDHSPEIRQWLSQFPADREPTAIDVLLKLQFIRRDVYADWVKEQLSVISDDPCALYAVRKFDGAIESYWDANGNPPGRPAESQGSEEIVHSVLGNLRKAGDERFLDHPGHDMLRQGRVRNIVLIDDSIGSGQRVSDFINLMMNSKTILSWWSYRLIQIHVVSFIRTHNAEERIRKYLPGSDHHQRVHRKSEKLHFVGHHHFDDEEFEMRWGANSTQILNLCDSVEAIPRWAQRGYGSVMSNQVFYHSVPDNTPGILWSAENGWVPLMPNRSFPAWLASLLAGQQVAETADGDSPVSRSLLSVLLAAQKGIRAKRSISRAIGLDPKVTEGLVAKAQAAGFLNQSNRLTEVGKQAIWDSRDKRRIVEFDRSLYVPTKWCVGRGTVQPSGPIEATRRVQAESEASVLAEDGDAGQASLEKTDARSAAPPLSVVTQQPSGPRVGDDAHGPKGERDK